ncbi:MAG: phosphatidylserine decarboxylase family protein [Verrucomicrobia bacterium]|nr:MAG: phosphatidylserine decarboxylase family protein [Verrucomicrobiota bacterium]
MKYSGRARKAAFKLVFLSLLAGIGIWILITFASAVAAVLTAIASAVAVAATPVLLLLWILYAGFTFYFFRDPTARVPSGSGLILSPAHGKVDVIDTRNEPNFMGGQCQRISVFLSVFDVHVQNAPVSGKIAHFKYSTGQFLNALKTESSLHNENVLLGFEASDPPGQKIGVRLIAGVIARRIVCFISQGEEVARGQRISLIQYGSRADVYLPLNAKIKVQLGDHVVGGETVLAVMG